MSAGPPVAVPRGESPRAEAQEDSWEPGESVGNYALIGRVAEGGMAEIWLARQGGLAGFQRVVVVKKISDAYSDDKDFVEMFLDEARLAAQLSHPNVVQIFDLGAHRSSYYLTMEYLHGEDLGQLVRASVKAGKPLPLSQAVRIVASAADGLAYAHDKVGLDGKPLNIVHRDVSPQNIFITYDGGVKVLDFGIAKARSRQYQTMDGSIKGKVSYLSPEQARGKPLDCRSDVFSLGICLYEALGRCRLFDHEEMHQNLMSIAGDSQIPPPSTMNPEIPPELDAIVMRALARPLELRHLSARHFQVALEDWLRKTSDAPGSFELSATMRGLFADRISRRTRMIENARQPGARPTFEGRLLTEVEVPAADPTMVSPSVAGLTVIKERDHTPASGAPSPTVIVDPTAETDKSATVAAVATVAPPRTEMPAVHSGNTGEQKVPTDLDVRRAQREWRLWLFAGFALLAALFVCGYLWFRR